jgi:hypothetical protein
MAGGSFFEHIDVIVDESELHKLASFFFQVSIKLSSQPDELSGLHKEPFGDFRFLRIAPH